MKLSFRKILTVLLTFALTLTVAAGLAACTQKEEEVKYTLSYGKGAYVATGEIPESKEYKEGEEVTLAPSDTFRLKGYTFAGWSDGTEVYEGGAVYTMPAHDVKLMGKWVEGDPDAPVVTAASVGFEDGYFVFKGSAKNVEKLYVYLNNSNVSASIDNHAEADIADGTFTARLSLDTLIGFNAKNTPFNLRYRIDDTASALTGVVQGNLSLAQTCAYGGYNFRLAVNSGTSCVSVYYAALSVVPDPTPDPDTAVEVAVNSVSFDEGYLAVGGTVKNVTDLYLYLINTYVADSLDNFVKAEVTGNTFTVRLPLDNLIGFNKTNTPFNLRYRVNESTQNVNIAQGSLDITQTHNYSEYDFRLGVNSGCVAVYYEPAPDTTVEVSVTSVSFDEGYLAVSGTVKNVTDLYLYLINTNVADSMNNFVTAVITDNTFIARLSLATIIGYEQKNIPFNLRYRVNESTLNVNIPQGSLDITQTHTYADNNFRMGINGGCVAVYYDAVPVEPEPVEPGEPDYTVSVSNMYFAGGKFIVEGECGADVESLIFHLHNTNAPVINFTSEAVIDNGEYKAEFVLSEIKREDGSEPPATYINVRYEINDDGYKSLNLVPDTNGSFVVGQEYRYGERTWTLKADSNRTYLNWSAVTDSYRITEVKLEIVGGKPTLTIAGTTNDATVEAANLKLLLDKTSETKEQRYIENSETEAGKFLFVADLSGMIASSTATAANQQKAYFIRLYNGTTKLADLNSRWASDLLWEIGQIETEDAVYFLMKNTEWSNTAWNTLGICKFDK